MQQESKAILFLLFITMLWGATFPIVSNAVITIDPSLFVGVRFFLGALLFLPMVWKDFAKSDIYLIGASLLLGVINSVAYTSQTIGLQTIDPPRSAFITGMAVILVPIISALLKLGKLQIIDIICSLICVFGLYVLTGASIHSITRGDEWTLLCAFTFAIQISYSQYITLRIDNYKLLTFYQLLFTAPLPFFYAVSHHANLQALSHHNVIFALVFCAFFATTLAYYLQIKYQKFTTAPKAALIFCMEPVFASLITFFIYGKALSHNTIVGGLIILLSLTLPSLLQLAYKTFLKH